MLVETISHGEVTVRGTPTRGCSQRKILSPLLWWLVLDEFLVKLQAGFFTFGYAVEKFVTKNQLIYLQNKYLRAAVEVLKTAALQVALNVPPLD